MSTTHASYPLDPDQQRAMTLPVNGRTAIVAGAGSGKTTTLVARAAFARKFSGNHNGTVLCLSYTNKTADELGLRLRSLLERPRCVESFRSLERDHPGLRTRFWCGTLHSLAKYVIEEITYPSHWNTLTHRERVQLESISEMYSLFARQGGHVRNIIDDSQAESLWEDTVLGDSDLGPRFLSWKRRREDVCGIWANRQAAQMIGQLVPIPVPHTTEAKARLRAWDAFDITDLEQHAAALYQVAKQEQKVVDYNDLLCMAAAGLTYVPVVRDYYRDSLSHVLIDEFQDHSFLDFVFLKSLPCFLPEGDNTVGYTIIGDRRQEIYNFRPGQSDLLGLLLGAGWATDTCRLSTNYRCAPEIIALAGKIAQNNRLYMDYEPTAESRMTPAPGCPPGKVSWTVLPKDERITDVLPTVIRRSLQGDYRTRALLVRNNWMKRDLEECLSRVPGSSAKFEVSTVHSAKGREWDHVILSGLARDKFPTKANFWVTAEENLRTESRLLYVAVTRARRQLDVFERENGAFHPALHERTLDL